MASETITVRYNSSPVITRILRDSRNEVDPDAAVNITGYTIKLIVKQSAELADSRAWFDLAASIVTAADGSYRFTMTPEHTSIPAGSWPGEIRWWSGSTDNPPTDATQILFVVEESLDLAGA
jgi:hypothetical protein